MAEEDWGWRRRGVGGWQEAASEARGAAGGAASGACVRSAAGSRF